MSPKAPLRYAAILLAGFSLAQRGLGQEPVAPAQPGAFPTIQGTTEPDIAGSARVAGIAPVPAAAVHVPVTDPLLAPLGGSPVPVPPAECDPLLSAAPRRFEAFPASLLWEPLLAVKRDPRTGFLFSNIDKYGLGKTTDPSIGTTFGLFRFHRDGSPVVWQTDAFAVVHSRFIRNDILANTDYRAGVLETARVGNWATKFGYEHTSTHIGDEVLAENVGARMIGYERDEAVVGLSYLYANQVRVYGVAAWSFYRKIGDLTADTRPAPYRFDIGGDWYKRVTTSRLGQPFAALNIGFDGATNYDASFNAQVGWMWKVLDRRLAQFRVYAEFYDGPSPFGQSFLQRERYAGFGLAMDY